MNGHGYSVGWTPADEAASMAQAYASEAADRADHDRRRLEDRVAELEEKVRAMDTEAERAFADVERRLQALERP